AEPLGGDRSGRPRRLGPAVSLPAARRFRRAIRPGNGRARARRRRPPDRLALRRLAASARSPARSRVDSWLATLAFASDEALRARLRAAAGADRTAPAGSPRRLATARLRPREQRGSAAPVLRVA